MRRDKDKQGNYLRMIHSPRLSCERVSLSTPSTPKPTHKRVVSDITNFLRFGTPADTIVHVPTLVARLNSKSQRDLTHSPVSLDPPQVTQFLEAVKSGDTTSAAQALTLDKRLIHAKDSIGQSAVHWAAKRNDVAMVKLLKAAGGDLNAVDIALRTPLMLAARKDYSDIVQFLLESGANKGLKSLTGATATDFCKEGSLSQALLNRRLVTAQAFMSALLDRRRKTSINSQGSHQTS